MLDHVCLKSLVEIIYPFWLVAERYFDERVIGEYVLLAQQETGATKG